MELQQASVVIVTGYSGAGKTSVLKACEDLGFFCIDNLPSGLLASFAEFVARSQKLSRPIALGIDIRSSHSMHELLSEVDKLIEQFHVTIIFLTASSHVLVKRFQETRRRHPLDDTIDLADAIEQEKIVLEPLRQKAHIQLDTDQLTIHDLRALVRTCLTGTKPRLLVTLVSFGFKYGIPFESNFIYDLRSLPNPYFVPVLKHYDGTHTEIQKYLFEHEHVQEYWVRLYPFFIYSLEQLYKEGRSCATVAFGCTGGRHRSVAFVEKLAKEQIEHVYFLVKHRDITHDTTKTTLKLENTP